MYSHNTGGPLLNIREVAKSSTVNKCAESAAEATTPLPSLIEQDEDQSTLTSRAGQELLKSVQNGVEQQQTIASSAQNGPTTEAQKHENVHDILAHPSPMVSMVSKHANGTLNLWQLTFADKTKFSQVCT